MREGPRPAVHRERALTSGSLLAVAAGSPGSWLRSPGVWRWQQRLAGLLLVAFSLRLALA